MLPSFGCWPVKIVHSSHTANIHPKRCLSVKDLLPNLHWQAELVRPRPKSELKVDPSLDSFVTKMRTITRRQCTEIDVVCRSPSLQFSEALPASQLPCSRRRITSVSPSCTASGLGNVGPGLITINQRSAVWRRKERGQGPARGTARCICQKMQDREKPRWFFHHLSCCDTLRTVG